MKATFETDDVYEIKQIAKANDMAMMIWELYHNQFKYMSVEDTNVVLSLLERFNINVDDLNY